MRGRASPAYQQGYGLTLGGKGLVLFSFQNAVLGKMFRDNWLRNFKNGKFSQKIRPDSQKMSINR